MQESGKKIESGEKVLKAGVWYTISTVFVKAISVITMPIYTRLLSTHDYGVASTFSSWYSLMLIICSLDLEMSIGRAKQDYGSGLKKYVGSLQVLSGLFSVILFSFCGIFLPQISALTEMNYGLLMILAVYLLFSPAVSFAQANYRYEYRYKENIAIMIFISVTTVLASLVLIYVMPTNKYYGKVIGSAIPTVALGVYYWISGLNNGRLSINTSHWKYALTISAPMIIHSLSLNALSTSDRVVITKLVGAEATGIYTLAYQYALLINVVMSAVNQAWQPWFHDNYYVGNYEQIKKNANKLTVLGCFIGVGCVSLAPEMISLLGPEEYKSGVWAVPPIVLGVVCQFLYTHYINVELHLKKTKYASYGTVIAAALNIGLNIVFVGKYGFVAAAYTTLFSYIVLLVAHFCITRFLLKVNLYDNKFFVGSFIGVALLSGIFMALFDHFIIRFLLMSIIGIVFLFYNREMIKTFLNKGKIKKG